MSIVKMYSIEYPEVDDNFRLVMTFESGLSAQVEVSTNNYITHPRWYVLGTQGTLQIDDWDCHGQIVRCIDKKTHGKMRLSILRQARQRRWRLDVVNQQRQLS